MMKIFRQYQLYFLLGLGVSLVVFLGYYFLVRPTEASSPIIIAVLDTGINLSSLKNTEGVLAKNVAVSFSPNSPPTGWNFFDQNADVTDADGHGTAVVQEILDSTRILAGKVPLPGIYLLPIRMSHHGAGVRPADLARAINYALDKGAKIINFSAGITQGSDELKAAVKRASDKKTIIILASGVGVPNPFKPVDVSTLFPHSYPEVIVSGMTGANSIIDPSSNFGALIDFVVPRQAGSARVGSSFAAAAASGIVGRYLLEHPSQIASLGISEIRGMLRAASRLPESKGELRSDYSSERLGFGVLDIASFFKEKPGRIAHQVVHTKPTGLIIKLSATSAIQLVEPRWTCQSSANPEKSDNQAKSEISGAPQKGIVSLVIPTPPLPECKLSIRMILDGNKQEEIVIKF